MFVDKATVVLQAGNGGNGVVSFRHEKFVDKGGPDGGDGGHGGSIIFQASRNENTLASFRYQKLLKAQDGQSGSKSKKRGRTGHDLVVKVPVGTVIASEDGTELADLTEDGQQAKIAEGGKGGFGNAHFVSSVRQTPRVAEKGELGQKINAILELKMIADVGLVGLPNAGKSTLLSVITKAEPEIASYAFTTVIPNLSVADIDETSSLLIADIPGLIEGASQGKGLGDDFLRHIERSGVLVHLIDIYESNIIAAYKTIQSELASYKTSLSKRPQVVVLTKIEGLDQNIIDERIKELRLVVPVRTKVLAISALSKQNLPELLFALKAMVEKSRRAVEKKKLEADQLPVIRPSVIDEGWRIKDTKGGFIITGQKIESFAKRTDFNDEYALARVKDIMRKIGITKELNRKSDSKNKRIIIGNPEIGSFDF